MEINQSISHNTFNFLVEKYSISRLTVLQKKSRCLCIGLISREVFHIWTYKHGRLARSNNHDDNKQKSSAMP